jgi:hypothetical protein
MSFLIVRPNRSARFTVQLVSGMLEKVQAFAYFEEVIRQHRPQLTSLTVQQAYADNIPVSSSASASEEANRVSCQLYESFFEVANLDCLGFYESDGSKAIAIALATAVLTSSSICPLSLLPHVALLYLCVPSATAVLPPTPAVHSP